MIDSPLIALTGVGRSYGQGEAAVKVLREVDLTIQRGEMVAIIGTSGSGKSTLMNILGCLDRPSEGTYRIAGQDTGKMMPDELARLRREHFGFIFQRYHLLSDLTAQANVEMPAVYAGWSGARRRERAQALLSRLGLHDRMHHRPNALSGGQQQRVSIARALTNGGEVILADEPTGALDSRSGREVMAILQELNAAGHTIIIVTHDAKVAQHARRVIEISDGRIVADQANSDPLRAQASDSSTESAVVERAGIDAEAIKADARSNAVPESSPTTAQAGPADEVPLPLKTTRLGGASRTAEAFKMAWLAMTSHRLRTFLTMLGIVIGIAAVMFVVALGQASQRLVLADIEAIGTNMLYVAPGRYMGDDEAGSIRTLTDADAAALARTPYIDSATPSLSSSARLRYRNVSVNASVLGVGEQEFRVRNTVLIEGRLFDTESVRRLALDAVIDEKARDVLFGKSVSAVGQVVLINQVPVRIVGVTQTESSNLGGSPETLEIKIPYTTAMRRVLGQDFLQSIALRVSDSVAIEEAERAVEALLTQRHGRKDFYIFNANNIRKTIESTMGTLTLLVASIALISLFVGGIGVMNIMLVSVSERTGEIGVRMAVGARRGDILRQFLIEAILVCLIGGGIGVGLALGLGRVVSGMTGGAWALSYSPFVMAVAVGCSTLVGVVFGFLPARNAARLDPVNALARD